MGTKFHRDLRSWERKSLVYEKSVIPIRPLSVCPICLCVTLVYCGQMVGWINMKLCHEGRPRPWPHCVRWGPSPLSPKGAQPQFRPISVVAKWLDGLRVGPGDFVLDWDPAPLPKKGHAEPPNLRPTSIVAKRLDGSRYHLVRR